MYYYFFHGTSSSTNDMTASQTSFHGVRKHAAKRDTLINLTYTSAFVACQAPKDVCVILS